jgi:hypothetical protein
MMEWKVRIGMLVACLAILNVAGCGAKADEKKPIAEVKAEAEAMDTDDLREMAVAYKEAIVAKKGDANEIKEKIKEIPVSEILSEGTKELKADVEEVLKSVSALKARFDIYFAKLKEKGGDLSNLKLE